jgi:hypothetical protein
LQQIPLKLSDQSGVKAMAIYIGFDGFCLVFLPHATIPLSYKMISHMMQQTRFIHTAMIANESGILFIA